jgi:hypothetical protein
MLTDRDLEILTFEDRTPRHTTAKEDRIRERWGISPARYYQIVGSRLQEPEAVAKFPQLANRRARRQVA